MPRKGRKEIRKEKENNFGLRLGRIERIEKGIWE
jgi:hypothetical protein